MPEALPPASLTSVMILRINNNVNAQYQYHARQSGWGLSHDSRSTRLEGDRHIGLPATDSITGPGKKTSTAPFLILPEETSGKTGVHGAEVDRPRGALPTIVGIALDAG